MKQVIKIVHRELTDEGVVVAENSSEFVADNSALERTVQFLTSLGLGGAP